MKYSVFKTEIINLLEERQTFHPNDDFRIYQYWEKVSNLLVSEEKKTIQFLTESDKETIKWMREVFEDVSEKLKSKNIISTFNKLNLKFPDLNLTSFY